MAHARHTSGTMPPEAGTTADRQPGQRPDVRGITRWTAVVLAAVCTAAASSISSASYGSVPRQPTQHTTKPADPVAPGSAVTRPGLSQPRPVPSVGEPSADVPHPVANQAPQPAGISPFSLDGAVVIPEPSLDDDGTAGLPEPGSRPRVGLFTPSGDAADLGADTHEDLAVAGPPGRTHTGWSILSGPVAGGRIFLAGFFALLFSIGGLVTIGIRRRQW